MKIFFTAEYSETDLRPLYEIGEIVLDGWAVGLPKLAEEELMEKTKDADMIITSYDDITARVIENAARLKLIACTRATPVNVDTAAAAARHIPVLYTPGRNSDSTAELTIGLMLSIARKIPMAHSALKRGEFVGGGRAARAAKAGLKQDVIWDMTESSPYVVFKGTQLKGKTLGIIGYGSIGRRVGRIARAMGMSLLIFDPYQSEIEIEEIGIKKAVTIEALLQESDVVTSHMKVTPETTKMIDRGRLALMKPTAFFINASRGAIVDEAALIDALRGRRIAGAALDVYEAEPIPAGHPYIEELDNVVITPHIAGAAHEVLANHTRQIVADIKRFLNREHLLYQYRG